MNGRFVGNSILVSALGLGAVLWPLGGGVRAQVAGGDTSAAAVGVTLVNIATGEPETIRVEGLESTGTASAPDGYRACFTPEMSFPALSETFLHYETPAPGPAPDSFGCFDAGAIGDALETGEAFAFLGKQNVHPGVDRVVAVFPDGRAFAWTQLNETYAE